MSCWKSTVVDLMHCSLSSYRRTQFMIGRKRHARHVQDYQRNATMCPPLQTIDKPGVRKQRHMLVTILAQQKIDCSSPKHKIIQQSNVGNQRYDWSKQMTQPLKYMERRCANLYFPVAHTIRFSCDRPCAASCSAIRGLRRDHHRK